MKTKAIFLLVIFLLNTVVGFGCALGMEDDFHDQQHAHQKSANRADNDHEHDHSKGHKHQTTPISGLHLSKEDLCCKNLVNDLVTQSKQIPERTKMQVLVPIICLPDFTHALLAPRTVIKLSQSIYVDHRERPPNQDIRTIIQSFQI